MNLAFFLDTCILHVSNQQLSFLHYHFRLKQFKVDLDKDIIAVVSDRASVMISFGSKISPLHFQCQAHGVQLAVCDVLYKKKKPKQKGKNEDEEHMETDKGERNV